ncbi:MAG: class I SAM-dependent methyltransferase [Selenomonadaceae bacterium]|nr:class I SAM-dependent methyltransferase [Selenomonadaceae bacterium]
MDNEQYRNLMWHLLYVESLMENGSDATSSEACECPICKSKLRAYLPAGVNPRPNAMCPNCSSRERHRALWLLMQKLNWHKQGMRVLHFAPEPIFYQLFSSFKDTDYWPVDLNPEMPGIRKVVDITDIPFEDNSFDLIMCTHVLEHIPDDRKAMRELY